MSNWQTVTKVSPYVPNDPNARGYIFDFEVETKGHERIEEMPFDQMHLLLTMALTGRLMYDVENNHFNLAGDGSVANLKVNANFKTS